MKRLQILLGCVALAIGAQPSQAGEEIALAATTVAEWQERIAQVEAPSMPSPVQVTDVRLESTETGLNLVLVATTELSAPMTRTIGNALIADIANATLSADFQQAEPIAGIALVSVTQLPGDRIRVAITGTDAPPTAQINATAAELAFTVTTGATTDTGQEEAIELVVTGEQAEGYAVNRSTVGTRIEADLRDVPQSIQVVTQQVLQDQGETNFNDALRNVAGVSQAALGRIDIRGFRATDNIRRNGAAGDRIGQGDGQGPSTSNLSLADVEQIEVLRGPAGVLYGSGEPGGTINITTKQPLPEPRYELRGIVGQFDFYRPSIDLTGPLNQDRTILYRFNAFYDNTNSFIDFVETEGFGVYPVVRIELGENTTLTVEGSYREETITGFAPGLPLRGTFFPNPLGEIPRDRNLGEPDFNRSEFVEWAAGYRLEHRLSQDWSLRNSFTANVLDIEFQDAFPLELAADNRTLNREFGRNLERQENYNLQTDIIGRIQTGTVQHELLVGVELYRGVSELIVRGVSAPAIDVFNPVYGNLTNAAALDTAPIAFASRDIGQTIGLYAQNLVSIGDDLKILLGGRLDWNFSEGVDLATGERFERDAVNSFSPRIGIVYQPIEPLSLYGSYSTFFLPQFGSDRSGNPFEPITGRQLEVGIKGDLFDGRASATLAAFQINRRNDFVPDPVDPDNFSIQLGEIRSRGIEFDLSGEVLPGLNLIATYALTDNQIVEDTRFGFVGNRPMNVPLHSGSLWAVYEVQRGKLQGLGVGAGVFVVGERQANPDNTFTIPSYARVDAVLYYQRDNWRMQLNVENLLNANYIQSSDFSSLTFGAPLTVRGTVSVIF